MILSIDASVDRAKRSHFCDRINHCILLKSYSSGMGGGVLEMCNTTRRL